MSRMDARYISLIGKLITKYQVMSDLMEYEEHERDLLRLAKTEYDFYHAHERVEAGTEASRYTAGRGEAGTSENTPKDPSPRKTLSLAGRSSKATS